MRLLGAVDYVIDSPVVSSTRAERKTRQRRGADYLSDKENKVAEKFNKEEYMATLQDRLTKIVVDETHLTINVDDHYQYEIALDRIDNPVKILQWVIHLTEKTWMTTELMRRFVLAACTKAGVDPNYLPA